eukprot:561151-Prymnesium_polylepis.1
MSSAHGREGSKVNRLFALDSSAEDMRDGERRVLDAYRAELRRRVVFALDKTVEKRLQFYPPREAPNLLCKVYPSKLHERSENYDPVGAFDVGAQLISINMQVMAEMT